MHIHQLINLNDCLTFLARNSSHRLIKNALVSSANSQLSQNHTRDIFTVHGVFHDFLSAPSKRQAKTAHVQLLKAEYERQSGLSGRLAIEHQANHERFE
jgi:hypothetical protein